MKRNYDPSRTTAAKQHVWDRKVALQETFDQHVLRFAKQCARDTVNKPWSKMNREERNRCIEQALEAIQIKTTRWLELNGSSR